VAQQEETLALFLKNPRQAAINAGLAPEEVALLMTRDAHKIFEALQAGPIGGIVWISLTRPRPPKRPKPAKRPARSAKKAAARRKAR
jgi:hypothetical protein